MTALDNVARNKWEHSNSEERRKPNRKTRARILLSDDAEQKPNQARKSKTFDGGVEKSAHKDLCHSLQVGNGHFTSLRSSISRKRLSSSASMASSCRMFSTNASWELRKKRPTKCRISERVPASRP